MSDVYVTIGLDKTGNIVEVKANDRLIEPRKSTQGMIAVGGSCPGCEEVIERQVHELLTCRSRSAGGLAAIPCCIRDPITGRIWCWC
jgi:hypothetical protein